MKFVSGVVALVTNSIEIFSDLGLTVPAYPKRYSRAYIIFIVSCLFAGGCPEQRRFIYT